MINTGEQQPENDHNFKGEQSENGLNLDRHFRNTKAWFSYELKNKDMLAKKLRLVLNGRDKNKNFDIFINGVLLTEVMMDGFKSGFYNAEYLIPTSMLAQKMEVKFVAKPKSTTANIYEVRLVK